MANVFNIQDAPRTVPKNPPIYIASNFRAYDASGSSDNRLYIRTSLDGLTWHVINGGNPVYTAPGWGGLGSIDGVVRDPSIFYNATDGFFYVAHTAGTYGRDGYFSVLRSSDCLTWTKIKEVDTSSIATPGDSQTWDPFIFQDSNGTIRVYIAIQAEGFAITDLTLYTTYPTTADWSGAWAALTVVDMPNANDKPYNDCFLWRGTDGYLYMIAADYASGSPYKVFHAGNGTNYNGPFTLIRSLGQDSLEGNAVIPLADGTVWFYLEGLGNTATHFGYRRWQMSPGLSGTGLTYSQGADVYQVITDDIDSGRWYNGGVIRYSGPLAASLLSA